MKQLIIGTFASRPDAEDLIDHLHRARGVPQDEISYVYRNIDGEVTEVDTGEVASKTPKEGAKRGAVVGGAAGALAGVATVVGVIPVVGPIFAAGPLIAALGIGAGAVGTTAAAAATGAAAGGVIGALTKYGASAGEAKSYEDRVFSGDVLVAVHADDENGQIAAAFADHGASAVNVYTPQV